MKVLLHYAPMVGVPLLGVAFALRVGTHLEAPPSVGGAWRVTQSGDPGPACTPVGAVGTLRQVEISQSGSAITLMLRGEGATIQLHGTVGARPDSTARLAGRGIQLSGGDGALRMKGEVYRDSVPAQLRLALTDPACGGGPDRQVVAERAAGAKDKGAH